MDKLQIIGLPVSNFVWTTRIACAEKGVAHEIVPVPPHSPELAAIHPLGRMPAMRHGDLTLFESRAICAYVDAAFEGPALMPRDPRSAAIVEQWLSLVVTTMEPLLIRRYLFGYMFPGTPDGSPDRARIDAALPEASRYLALLEDALADGYLGGSGFSLADAYLVPILFYLRDLPETGQRIAASPTLTGYVGAQLARPSVEATVPDRPA